MNLKLLKEKLLKAGEKVALKVDEEDAKSLAVHSDVTAKDYYPGSIYFRIVTYTSGTLHVFFTFDEVERTYDNLYLINNFNTENPWFKAYIASIEGKDYLELHYTAVDLEKEEQVVDTAGFLLNELVAENTVKYLKPIFQNK